MKEAIISAFDGAVSQRLEDVRRSENQRQMPGWNFCTFFLLKVYGFLFLFVLTAECSPRKRLQALIQEWVFLKMLYSPILNWRRLFSNLKLRPFLAIYHGSEN